MKLLIIDDEEEICELMALQFRLEGIEAITTCKGEEVMGLVKGDKPDIIISDIQMPNYSGVEILEEVIQFNPKAKVIMMSGFTTVDEETIYQKGAKGFIAKPFQFPELLALVRSVSNDQS